MSHTKWEAVEALPPLPQTKIWRSSRRAPMKASMVWPTFSRSTVSMARSTSLLYCCGNVSAMRVIITRSLHSSARMGQPKTLSRAVRDVIRGMRVHQWLKNLLILVPVMLFLTAIGFGSLISRRYVLYLCGYLAFTIAYSVVFKTVLLVDIFLLAF